MTSEQRARYLARQARYNSSVKGQERNRRYEEAHPDRRQRWPVVMLVRSRNTPPA